MALAPPLIHDDVPTKTTKTAVYAAVAPKISNPSYLENLTRPKTNNTITTQTVMTKLRGDTSRDTYQKQVEIIS